MKLKKVDWYGLDHEEVNKKFSGDLTFVNYMNVGDGGDLVAAVYRASKPNRELGHKDYMLLFKTTRPTFEGGEVGVESQWMVSGMDEAKIKKHAKVPGLQCLVCDKVLFSLNRHHWHSCGCQNTMFVDGGKDYMHFGAAKLSDTKRVTINLLTDKITVDRKARKK